MAVEDEIRRAASRYDGEDNEAARLAAAALARLAWRLRRGGKACSTCKALKPVAAFGRDRTRRDGLRSVCRDCRSTRSAEA